MNQVQVGSAKVDITPPLTIPYLGYEPRHAFFHGVHDPLFARAVVVNDDRTQVAVIAADAIGFSNDILGPGRNFTAEVRQRIERQIGIPAAHIMLTSSHAHSTPETIHLRRLLDTPAAAPWLETLMDQLASAAIMAAEHKRPASLKVGIGEVQGLSRNRRVIGPDGHIAPGGKVGPGSPGLTSGPIDPRVAVLYCESDDGKSCVVLANFACHPVTVQVQPYVSADYPGPAMALVEASLPHCTNSLFLQGACADQNPIRNTSDFADVTRYGLMLGGEIIKVAARVGAPDHPALPARVSVLSETIDLAVRDLPAPDGAIQAMAEADRRLGQSSDEEERRQWARKRRMAEEEWILIERGRAPIAAEVQVIRLGDVALVALPGEPFVELGLAIQERSAAPYTLVVGYANDWIGYLTTEQAWQQGGYEVSLGPWTRVGSQGGCQLVDKAVEMVARLWQT